MYFPFWIDGWVNYLFTFVCCGELFLTQRKLYTRVEFLYSIDSGQSEKNWFSSFSHLFVQILCIHINIYRILRNEAQSHHAHFNFFTLSLFCWWKRQSWCVCMWGNLCNGKLFFIIRSSLNIFAYLQWEIYLLHERAKE